MSTQRTAWKKVWIWMNCEYERYITLLLASQTKQKPEQRTTAVIGFPSTPSIFVLWWVKWKIIKRMWLLIIIFLVIKHLCQSQWKRKKKILNKWVFIINVYFCMCSKVRLWHLEKYDRCQDQVLSDICPVKNRSTASSHWAQGNKLRQESSQASLSNGNKTSLPATLNLISRHVHTQGL